MIRFIYADKLGTYPDLRDSMFRDRADQFKNRLKWDVTVDENGFERDEYDDLNPLYVIWERPDGLHGGSMRFLPTTGRCMANDHFLDLMDGVRVESPAIWECTRFCLAPHATPQVSALLMLAGAELMENFALKHFLGVFDARMVRIYRWIGASPTILGTQGKGRDAISVGLWEFSDHGKERLLKKANVSANLARQWFDLAFGQAPVSVPLSA
jgi:acyl homoserine lactone synthase